MRIVKRREWLVKVKITKLSEYGEFATNKMNRLNTYQLIAMGVMVLIIILLSQCNGNLRSKLDLCLEDCGNKKTVLTPPDTEPVITSHEAPEPTVVYKDSIVYKWKTIYRDTGQTITIRDTVLIIRDWLAYRYYSDTLRDDSSAFIAVYDTLTQNKLLGRSYAFQNRRGDNVVEVEKDLKFRVYAGGFIGGENFEAGLSALAIPGNDRFAVRYDYDLINRGHRVGVLWKLSFRR